VRTSTSWLEESLGVEAPICCFFEQTLDLSFSSFDLPRSASLLVAFICFEGHLTSIFFPFTEKICLHQWWLFLEIHTELSLLSPWRANFFLSRHLALFYQPHCWWHLSALTVHLTGIHLFGEDLPFINGVF
jgi:hypothetical protein